MAPPLPTGCFKCGRPGHWSRDCPSEPGAPAPAPAPASTAPKFKPKPAAAPAPAPEGEETTAGGQPQQNQKKKKKRERAARPKLTPDLLLSDDGLGFVLRYFPKAFRPRARPGHEVEDLGNLIRLYTDWHSRLIPYYSFEQFVRNVEKVGASNRVRRCISELRERVARGGDPTQLHGPLHEPEVMPEGEPDGTAAVDTFLGTEAPLAYNLGTESVREDIDPPMESTDVDSMQEDLLNEIYKKATDAEPQILGPQPEGSVPREVKSQDDDREGEKQEEGGGRAMTGKVELTEEQRARMEANRVRALERAAAARAQAISGSGSA